MNILNRLRRYLSDGAASTSQREPESEDVENENGDENAPGQRSRYPSSRVRTFSAGSRPDTSSRYYASSTLDNSEEDSAARLSRRSSVLVSLGLTF